MSVQDTLERLKSLVNRARLVETAVRLIEVPSRTGEAGAVSDRLAAILTAEGFPVERPDGGYPEAPAVAARLDTGRPGRTLQFDGHLDTVHLPFVAPGVADGRITGSGSADMKGGIAAAVEALRILREAGTLTAGSVLLTAHDLHESPWGDGRQLDAMVRAGYVGDAVLLPEYLNDVLPVAGRGLAIWAVDLSREAPAVHEVMRPTGLPSVLEAGASLVRELFRMNGRLAEASEGRARGDADPGPESVFVGQFHCGEIYNQDAQTARLEGTRRWLPGTDRQAVEREFREFLERSLRGLGVKADCRWSFTRDAFALDRDHPFVGIFRAAYEAASGRPLLFGPKPFVDDGNTFWSLAGVPAITHGPSAGGPHTLNEWVSIDDLERVALLYAATAASFCPGE
jgi:acetylornithine deacetylase/succinyl-diaminopimelate desuccinylase-like protein